jgi:inorganic pyrophosphatase
MQPTGTIKVLIQVEASSSARNIYNEKTLEFIETRQGIHPYPYPYGFIPGTNAEDGDCVDCYVITHDILKAGTIVDCEIIGLLEQDEDGEIDHKILAAIPGQKVEVNTALAQELSDFIQLIFSNAPEMTVKVGEFLPREEALKHIQKFQNK